jgi:hypothetical protein
MATQLSTLLTFIEDTFLADPMVNTVVFKDDDAVDVEKENIYPLVNITLLPSPRPDQNGRSYTLKFEVLNQRDDIKFIAPPQALGVFGLTFDKTFN